VRGLGVPVLDELLVPATSGQLAAAGGMRDSFDRDLRPALVIQVIAGNQAAGAEAAIWKVGAGDSRRRAGSGEPDPRGGRDHVDAIVLGRDAPAARLDHWLAVAAPVDGLAGFAIGRSIWDSRSPVTTEQRRRRAGCRPDRQAIPGLRPPVPCGQRRGPRRGTPGRRSDHRS
jgi:hypothetical protein